LNILTKICIVLLAIASVFASVVFVRESLTKENYRQMYIDQLHRADVLEASTSNTSLTLEKCQLDLRRTKEQLQQANTERQQDNAERDRQIAQLQAQLTKGQEINQDNAAQLEELKQHVEGLKEERRILTAQLDGLRGEIERLNAELTSNRTLIAEQAAEIETLEGIERLLNEQLTERDENIAYLQEKLKALEGEQPAEDAAPVAAAEQATIVATVTAVDDANDMASINVGSVKGVRKDMVFYIYRGDEFIAHLRILDVGDGESTGLIYDRREGAVPQTGDKVTTDLE